MTELSDIKYPLRLCVEMLYYSVLLNKKTQSMTIPEIRKALKVFFTDEQIDQAMKITSGESNATPPTEDKS
jgi:hypothetical protein